MVPCISLLAQQQPQLSLNLLTSPSTRLYRFSKNVCPGNFRSTVQDLELVAMQENPCSLNRLRTSLSAGMNIVLKAHQQPLCFSLYDISNSFRLNPLNSHPSQLTCAFNARDIFASCHIRPRKLKLLRPLPRRDATTVFLCLFVHLKTGSEILPVRSGATELGVLEESTYARDA
jgi:hypothetical protein